MQSIANKRYFKQLIEIRMIETIPTKDCAHRSSENTSIASSTIMTSLKLNKAYHSKLS